MSKFLSVLERELEHLERSLSLLEGRYGASAEREKKKLEAEWRAVRAAYNGYRKSTRLN